MTTDTAASLEYETREEGVARLIVTGKLDAETAGSLWTQIVAGTVGSKPRTVEVDPHRMEGCDGVGIALLQELKVRQESAGSEFRIEGLRRDLADLIALFEIGPPAGPQRRSSVAMRFFNAVGESGMTSLRDWRSQISFAGETAVKLAAVFVVPLLTMFNNLLALVGCLVVMRDISFEVRTGEVFVILGGSGCGKSTLLKSMIGLTKPVKGRVWIEGMDIVMAEGADLLSILQRIGVMYQQGALFGSMNLMENICLPLEEFTDLPPSAMETIARTKLKAVNLEGTEYKMPSELSGGMRTRAAIARAMALDPKILFLDEPSAGLDPITSSQLDELILKLSRTLRITFIIVTHELPSIFKIADRVIMLDKTRTFATRCICVSMAALWVGVGLGCGGRTYAKRQFILQAHRPDPPAEQHHDVVLAVRSFSIDPVCPGARLDQGATTRWAAGGMIPSGTGGEHRRGCCCMKYHSGENDVDNSFDDGLTRRDAGAVHPGGGARRHAGGSRRQYYVGEPQQDWCVHHDDIGPPAGGMNVSAF